MRQVKIEIGFFKILEANRECKVTLREFIFQNFRIFNAVLNLGSKTKETEDGAGTVTTPKVIWRLLKKKRSTKIGQVSKVLKFRRLAKGGDAHRVDTEGDVLQVNLAVDVRRVEDLNLRTAKAWMKRSHSSGR